LADARPAEAMRTRMIRGRACVPRRLRPRSIVFGWMAQWRGDETWSSRSWRQDVG